jgi:hypothetical protein
MAKSFPIVAPANWLWQIDPIDYYGDQSKRQNSEMNDLKLEAANDQKSSRDAIEQSLSGADFESADYGDLLKRASLASAKTGDIGGLSDIYKMEESKKAKEEAKAEKEDLKRERELDRASRDDGSVNRGLINLATNQMVYPSSNKEANALLNGGGYIPLSEFGSLSNMASKKKPEQDSNPFAPKEEDVSYDPGTHDKINEILKGVIGSQQQALKGAPQEPSIPSGYSWTGEMRDGKKVLVRNK